MLHCLKISIFGLITLLAGIAANHAQDTAYLVNALTVMFASGAAFLYFVRTAGDEKITPQGEYLDGVVRAAVIATAFWGIIGFGAGVFIAAQLAFPWLNFEALNGMGNFGRLRPLHTSAVIFAFCGNALLMSSFYIVQRTSAARLWGGNLAWFVFWGWQLIIVLAASGYVLGATQSREYAEPLWYVDIMITVVWRFSLGQSSSAASRISMSRTGSFWLLSSQLPCCIL